MITVPKELIEDLKWKENDELLLQSIPLTPDAYVGRPKYLKIDKEED